MHSERKLLDLTLPEFEEKINSYVRSIPSDFFDASWDKKAQKLMEELTGKDVSDPKSRLCVRRNHDFAQTLRLDVESGKKQIKDRLLACIINGFLIVFTVGAFEYLKNWWCAVKG